MRYKLHISRLDNVYDYSGGKRFRFAVVDLERAKEYPMNFVCMLPLRFSSTTNKNSKFAVVFGDKSLSMAKQLLADALKKESDSDVKDEIEKRLRLLEPNIVVKKVCVSCGKLFQADSRKGFRKKFCEKCMRQKFGSRE